MMVQRPSDPVGELLRSERAREKAARRTRWILAAVVSAVVLFHVLAARGIVGDAGRDLALSAGAVVMAVVLASPEKRQ